MCHEYVFHWNLDRTVSTHSTGTLIDPSSKRFVLLVVQVPEYLPPHRLYKRLIVPLVPPISLSCSRLCTELQSFHPHLPVQTLRNIQNTSWTTTETIWVPVVTPKLVSSWRKTRSNIVPMKPTVNLLSDSPNFRFRSYSQPSTNVIKFVLH